MADQTWSFRTRSGYSRTTYLCYFWELDGDPMTDDYTVDEISAGELWKAWTGRYAHDKRAEMLWGPDAAAIHWFVQGDGVFEYAPFRDITYMTTSTGPDDFAAGSESERARNFLNDFTWPVDTTTGSRLQWSRLPVIDKVWRGTNLPKLHATKGGFIQEVTGWKPSPLQAFVNLRQLAEMAELPYPRR